MAHKVLYILSVSEIGGAETDLINILKNINRSMFKPFVLIPSKGSFFNELRSCGIKSVILRLPPWRKLRGVPFWLPCIYQLYKLVKSKDISIIHVNDLWDVPFGVIVSKLAKIPCVAHVRGYHTKRRVKQYLLEKANKVIAVSKATEGILRDGGVSEDSIETIYAGIDFDSIPEYSENEIKINVDLPSDFSVMGTIANVFPIKGLEYFIESLRLLRGKRDFIMGMIVGKFSEEDQYYRRLRSLIEKYNLSTNIIFTGFKKNVFPYILAMDVFVLPSVSEGLGIVLLEAMATEKPIVAFRLGGIPEIVKDGESGILVKPKDIRAMSDAILYLINNKDVARKMGKAGEKIVRDKFSLQQEITQLERVYGELLSLRVSE